MHAQDATERTIDWPDCCEMVILLVDRVYNCFIGSIVI